MQLVVEVGCLGNGASSDDGPREPILLACGRALTTEDLIRVGPPSKREVLQLLKGLTRVHRLLHLLEGVKTHTHRRNPIVLGLDSS